jgi:hypothetical protein
VGQNFVKVCPGTEPSPCPGYDEYTYGIIFAQSGKQFIKIIKLALKPADYRKKIRKITDLWNEFKNTNKGQNSILKYVVLDEQTLRKMANPIKE